MRIFPIHPVPLRRFRALPVVLTAVLLLPLVGCNSLFGDSEEFYSDEEFIAWLNGEYDVTYVLNASAETCEQVIDPFTVRASISAFLQNNQIRTHVQFPDAPVPIIGYFDRSTMSFQGETTPVMVGTNLYALEMWNVDFDFDGDETEFEGGSIVPIGTLATGGGSVNEDCRRVFAVSGIRVAF